MVVKRKLKQAADLNKPQDNAGSLMEAWNTFLKQASNIDDVRKAVSALSREMVRVKEALDTIREMGLEETQQSIEARIADIANQLNTNSEQSPSVEVVDNLVRDFFAFVNEVKPYVHSQNTDTALGVQEQDLDMGGHNIVNVDGSEVATKQYVDDQRKLVPSGGTGGRSRMAAMDDVTISSPSDGEVLTYDSTTKKWGNEASSGGGVDTSGTPVANDFARFTDADTIEGRSYAEARADLSLEDADITTLAKTVKLDDLATPDDNTDLDASATEHGLLPKLENTGTKWLRDDGTWVAPSGAGDVVGPGSSVDNAIVRFDGVTGKAIQDYTSNPPTISDTGDITVDGDLTADNIITAGNVDGRDVSADGTKLDGVATGADVTGDNAPQAHAASHKTAGSDSVKLDELATPDDTTKLDVTTTYHGLVPKATNTGTAYLRDDATWATPAGAGDVTGPAASTDNMIARHSGTGGKTLQDYTSNPPTISDTGDMDVDGNVTADNFAMSGYIEQTEAAVPGTPSANVLRLYTEGIKGFSFFSFKDEVGMVRRLVRDSVFVAKNVTGSTIATGRIVYASGSDDDVPTIALAKADDAATMPAIGVTCESIDNSAFGRVMQVGALENQNTSAFSAGDLLYVSAATAGVPTATKPTAPNICQEIGTILVDSATVGTIQVVARSMTEFGIGDNDVAQIDDADAADNDYAKFTAYGLEGRSYAEVKADLDLEIGTDVLAQQTIGIADDNLLEVDGTPNANEYARFTANGLEGRTEAEFKADFNLEIGTDVLAEQTIGIADDNLVEVDGTPNDDEYARWTANGLEGRTEAEFKADFNLEIGTDVLAQQTIGIADNNLLEVDDADAADNDYAKFTTTGLEGRSYTEVKTDLSLDNVENTAHSTDAHTMTIDGRDVSADGTKLDNVVANTQAITHSIADNATVTVDDADAADNDYAKFTASGLEGRSYAELLTDLSGQADANFDWNAKDLDNLGYVALKQTDTDGDEEGDLWYDASENKPSIYDGAVSRSLGTVSKANRSIYVDAAATGNADGSSWTDAFTTIQAAVNDLEDIVIHAHTIYVRAQTKKTGTADENKANSLVDDGNAQFAAGDVGKRVFNITDGTWGIIDTFVDTGEVTIIDNASAALDLFPDGNEDYVIEGTPYREIVYLNSLPGTNPAKLIFGSVTIEPEYYWYAACDAQANAGEIKDASVDFSNVEVGDRVCVWDENGGGGTCQDYEYGTVDDISQVGSDIVRTTLTKTPTTGWHYAITKCEISGSDDGTEAGSTRYSIFNMETVSNITINGFYMTLTTGYAIWCAYKCVNIALYGCLFEECEYGCLITVLASLTTTSCNIEGTDTVYGIVVAEASTFGSQTCSFEGTGKAIYTYKNSYCRTNDTYIHNSADGVDTRHNSYNEVRYCTIHSDVTDGIVATFNSSVDVIGGANNATNPTSDGGNGECSYIG